MTYSQLISATKEANVNEVQFNPSRHQIKATLTDGRKVKVNYPTDQSATQYQNLLERPERHLRLEGRRHVGLVGPAHRPAAVRAPDRLLALPDEPGAGRRLEGDELRQEPRQADVAGLAEGDLQGRRRGGRGGGGAPGDQGVPREPEEVPGARRPDSERASCSTARPAPARRCSRAPSPARRASRSSRSPAPTSSRCSSASAPRACATCSSRRSRRARASSSSTRSTPSVATAAPAWAAGTTSASRR